jgi:hypothetical protein
LHESQLCSKLQSHVTSGSIPEQSRCVFDHLIGYTCPVIILYIVNNAAIIQTLKRVSAGTELTVSYIDENEDYEERQKQLQDYGFECTCAKCLAHE